MKTIIKLLLILVVVVCPYFAFGQTNDDYQYMKSLNAFNTIKAQVVELLNKNATLEKQHSFLEDEYYKIYTRIDELKKEIDDMVSYSWSAIDKKKKDKLREKELKEEYDKLNSELLVKKARNASLKGLNIDSVDTKRLWKLKKEQLDYHIRELEMEVELKERLFKDKSEKFSKEIDMLEKKVHEKRDAVSKIETDIAEFEKLYKDAPGEISELNEKVNALEKNVSDLRVERDILAKRNFILENKKKIDALSFENEIGAKERKRDILKRELDVLRKEYNILDEDLREMLSSQDRNKKIIELIKEYDTENKQLRKKIADLKEKVE